MEENFHDRVTTHRWKKNGCTLSSNALLQLRLICKAVLCMGRIGELSLHINANLYFHFGSRGWPKMSCWFFFHPPTPPTALKCRRGRFPSAVVPVMTVVKTRWTVQGGHACRLCIYLVGICVTQPLNQAGCENPMVSYQWSGRYPM